MGNIPMAKRQDHAGDKGFTPSQLCAGISRASTMWNTCAILPHWATLDSLSSEVFRSLSTSRNIVHWKKQAHPVTDCVKFSTPLPTLRSPAPALAVQRGDGKPPRWRPGRWGWDRPKAAVPSSWGTNLLAHWSDPELPFWGSLLKCPIFVRELVWACVGYITSP